MENTITGKITDIVMKLQTWLDKFDIFITGIKAFQKWFIPIFSALAGAMIGNAVGGIVGGIAGLAVGAVGGVALQGYINKMSKKKANFNSNEEYEEAKDSYKDFYHDKKDVFPKAFFNSVKSLMEFSTGKNKNLSEWKPSMLMEQFQTLWNQNENKFKGRNSLEWKYLLSEYADDEEKQKEINQNFSSLGLNYKGNIIDKPTLTMVGETEPEFIVPHSKLDSFIKAKKKEVGNRDEEEYRNRIIGMMQDFMTVMVENTAEAQRMRKALEYIKQQR